MLALVIKTVRVLRVETSDGFVGGSQCIAMRYEEWPMRGSIYVRWVLHLMLARTLLLGPGRLRTSMHARTTAGTSLCPITTKWPTRLQLF